MKLRLLSDLHTEFMPPGYVPPALEHDGDILILAGDIAVGRKNVEDVLVAASMYNNHVIYVPGNHEYYGHDMLELENLNLPKNVHYLNPGHVQIGGVTFIGATLWTDFRNNKTSEKVAGKYITDFKHIKGFTTSNAKELYEYHHNYIAKTVEVTQGKKIIVTHFLPGSHCVHPRWIDKGYPTDELNGYFAPEPTIDTTDVSHWLFGHTHDSIDVMKGDTRYLANPYGYYMYQVNQQFNNGLVIDV